MTAAPGERAKSEKTTSSKVIRMAQRLCSEIDSYERLTVLSPTLGRSGVDPKPCWWGGNATGIVRQKNAANQILARRHLASAVGELVPGVPEGEPLPCIDLKKPENTENYLAAALTPDPHSVRVPGLEVGGGGPSHEL